jgi:hypothetical protein
VERWSIEPPKDVDMRMPDWITKTVCFLCAQDRAGKTFYGGTGFFVQLREPECPDDLAWDYLVTAKHCVEKAWDGYGNLSCRMNMKTGGTKVVTLPRSSSWAMSEDADVAALVMPLENTGEDVLSLSPEMLATDAVIDKEQIGLGDEIFSIGLFKNLHGNKQNIPIMRTGIIASMPGEPIQDLDTGLDYRAFLIEARSIGGLSGSPVFMAIKNKGEMHPAPRGFNTWVHSLALLGLIRGHWDLEDREILRDFGDSVERLNMGIAIVTPAQEIEKVLMSDELKKQRQADIRKYRKEHAPTLDSGFTEEQPFTQPDFESALRKVSRQIEPSRSDEGKK